MKKQVGALDNGKTRRTALPAVVKLPWSEFDLDTWLRWLEDASPDGAFASVKKLITQGCAERFLVSALMALHGSRQWHPVSTKDAESALRVLSTARRTLMSLSDSDLAFFLHLRDPEHLDGGIFEGLFNHLKDIETQLLSLHGKASERRLLLRDTIISRIVIHVRRATKRRNDALLSEIVPVILGDPGFDILSWTKRNKFLLADANRIRRLGPGALTWGALID